MGNPHRLGTADCTGTFIYFLTICTRERSKYFTSDDFVALVRGQIVRASNAEGLAVLAYCFMPDHVHAVVEGRAQDSQWPRFVRLAKQLSSYAFRLKTGRRLWQNSYFDRTLRAEEALADVVRYVINNPVRAGLVDAPAAYPYWGSAVCSRKEILDFIAEIHPSNGAPGL